MVVLGVVGNWLIIFGFLDAPPDAPHFEHLSRKSRKTGPETCAVHNMARLRVVRRQPQRPYVFAHFRRCARNDFEYPIFGRRYLAPQPSQFASRFRIKFRYCINERRTNECRTPKRLATAAVCGKRAARRRATSRTLCVTLGADLKRAATGEKLLKLINKPFARYTRLMQIRTCWFVAAAPPCTRTPDAQRQL